MINQSIVYKHKTNDLNNFIYNCKVNIDIKSEHQVNIETFSFTSQSFGFISLRVDKLQRLLNDF